VDDPLKASGFQLWDIGGDGDCFLTAVQANFAIKSKYEASNPGEATMFNTQALRKAAVDLLGRENDIDGINANELRLAEFSDPSAENAMEKMKNWRKKGYWDGNTLGGPGARFAGTFYLAVALHLQKPIAVITTASGHDGEEVYQDEVLIYGQRNPTTNRPLPLDEGGNNSTYKKQLFEDFLKVLDKYPAKYSVLKWNGDNHFDAWVLKKDLRPGYKEAARAQQEVEEARLNAVRDEVVEDAAAAAAALSGGGPTPMAQDHNPLSGGSRPMDLVEDEEDDDGSYAGRPPRSARSSSDVDSSAADANFLDPVTPAELPMLCLAPPRQGKSALIWLMSSFAIKLGGTVLCGVAPNKKIPIAEMVAKLQKNLQWTHFDTLSSDEYSDEDDDEEASPASVNPPRRRRGTRQVERTTKQGLEVALAWAVDDKLSTEPGTSRRQAAGTTRRGKEMKKRAAILKTMCQPEEERTPAAPISLLRDEDRGTLLWKRLRATGTIVEVRNEKSGRKSRFDVGKIASVDAYNRLKPDLDRTQHAPLIGNVWSMMRQSKEGEFAPPKTHVFLYSQDTERDTLGVQQLARELLWGKANEWDNAGYDKEERKRQWVFHVRDEAQYLCKASAYRSEEYRCPKDGTHWKAYPTFVQEHDQETWRHAPVILDQLRTTYPLMRGLSMCVSGTILPCIVESKLWGKTKFESVATAIPAVGMGVDEWSEWFVAWDKILSESAQKAIDDKWRHPLLVSSLVPPKGRMATSAKMPMPNWMKQKDPPNIDRVYTDGKNVSRGPGRTYYGTMQHVKKWNGGDLCKASAGGSFKYPNLNEGRCTPGASPQQTPGQQEDNGELSYEVQVGLGKYLSPGMSILDMAHPTDLQKDLRKDITGLHKAYQSHWWRMDSKGNEIEHPLKRLANRKLASLNLDIEAYNTNYKIDMLKVAPPGYRFENDKGTRLNPHGRYPLSLAKREHESSLRLTACALSQRHLAKGKSQNKLPNVFKEVIERFNLRGDTDASEAAAMPFAEDLEYFQFRGLHYYTPTDDKNKQPVASGKVTNATADQRDPAAVKRLQRCLMPYRRPMALVLERPSADAVKILCHVKEWLEIEATEREYILNEQSKNKSVLTQVFSPMYILSPTNIQQNDNAGVEWARHSLKYAWLRMHKDFNRPKKDPLHPYKCCQSVEEFRRKYGVVVLVYASGLKEEQALRSALIEDVEHTLRREINRYAPGASEVVGNKSSVGANERANEDANEGRLLSILFDPALDENRLAQYDRPPHGWVANERRIVVQKCPTTSETPYSLDDRKPAEAMATKVDPAQNWYETTLERHDYSAPLSTGTMLNVAHAYRVEKDWKVGYEISVGVHEVELPTPASLKEDKKRKECIFPRAADWSAQARPYEYGANYNRQDVPVDCPVSNDIQDHAAAFPRTAKGSAEASG